jgi:pimeloyl-ACP methyl ester carboxylesterase
MSQIAIRNQIYSYEKLGSQGATPILIMHGWGRSKEEWLAIGKELSKEREVYLLDLPGFGGSTLPSQVNNMEEYTELVIKFCQYLKLKKLILIGHSLGGRVGVLMAQPNSRVDVEKLVLVDPAGVKSFSLKRLVLYVVSKMFFWVPIRMRRKLVRGAMDEDYQQSGKRDLLYRVVVGNDLRSCLSKIRCPVVVIWGENDNILPLSLVRVYRRLLDKNRVRLVWGAGHDPHLSHYPQLLAILQESI